MTKQTEALAERPAQQEPMSFLANGTRFKMSFFDCDVPEGDDHGESDAGTYVTCFESFAKELDGRWVALVAAEDDCHLKLTSPQPAQPQQEPVAWMHTMIDDVVIGHRPADIDRHPERWTPLYKEASPCPTCEALARTVMLDQTSHDTPPPAQRKPLTDEQILTVARDHYNPHQRPEISFARAIEAAHGIKENT